MKVIYTKAYAKLNLSLDVLSKRPDGYHDLCMVMQSVEHHDDVSILLNLEGQYYAQSDRRYLPNDERNIALKAARLFLEETGHADMGASVRLRKRIPVCAGLGGGSSDAAAVLRALNEHFDRPLSCSELEQMGMKLGMDVPYCIAGGTVLAGGGERRSSLAAERSSKMQRCNLQAGFPDLDAGALQPNRQPLQPLPPGHGGHSARARARGRARAQSAHVQRV